MSGRKIAHSKLGQFLSTAVCGNDIFSTVLYVVGVSVAFTGTFAPLILLLVSGILFFYRSVYREVMEALPMNGGVYNALLNATTKTFAALAGVISILSYIATAVISAKTAVEYLLHFLSHTGRFADFAVALSPFVLPLVVAILLFFAILVVVGLKDSARVASAIFILHLGTLTLFAGLGIWWVAVSGANVWELNRAFTSIALFREGHAFQTIFFGFSVSLLAIAGFQSSANFIEEQHHGVFSKTLRNMTIGSAIINPLIALIVLCLMPIVDIAASKDFLLSEAGSQIGGPILMGLISFDAFLVLCGALVTSFIGVNGLAKRMTLDGCLPRFLVQKASTQVSPRIVFTFFLFCLGVLFLTNGDLVSVAGVYTISFLAVMSFFALANLYLRKTRPLLERPYRAPFPSILIAFVTTLVGLLGNIALDVTTTAHFLLYFVPMALIVLSTVHRKELIATLHHAFRKVPPLERFFSRHVAHIADERIHVFINHLDQLSHVLEYIHRNESGRHIILVHCIEKHSQFSRKIDQTLKTLSEAGFYRDFHFEIEELDEAFSPRLLDLYAKKKRVSKSMIFMGSVRKEHAYTYEDLGGVRIVF